MKQLYLILLSLLIAGFTNAQGIYINEVQYTNKGTITDSFGGSPDWIELYNSCNMAVNIEGYALSDSKDTSDYWYFPDIEINAGEYLVVFASGKNVKSGRELHTDFKLKIMKDSLFLINSQGVITDSVVAQCVPAGNSIGDVNNGSTQRSLLTPTPGATNRTAKIVNIDFKPDSLIVNNPGGKYLNSVGVELKNMVQGNTIYYTTDGDDPDESETVYTSPFVFTDISVNENRFADEVEDFKPGNGISKANILRAVVYSEGCPASNEVSNTYFVGNETSFKYNVPVVSIITDENNLFDDDKGIYVAGNNENFKQRGSEWERAAHMEYYVNGECVVDQGIGIRINGSGSRSLPQKSLRLYAKEKYGKEKFTYPFFSTKPETDEFRSLVLRTPYFDFTGLLFKEELCHRIVDPMNIDNTAGQTVIAYMNGEYWGIYSLRERQDEQYLTNTYGIQNPDADVVVYQYDISANSGTMDSYNDMIFWLENNDPASDHFFKGASELIDMEGMADYFIAQLYLANYDFPNRNLDMWRLRNDTSRWRYFFFDLDAAMVKTAYDHLSEYGNTINDFQRFGPQETYLLRRMLQNNQFAGMFYSRYLNHLNTTFEPERVLTLIDEFIIMYKPIIAEQSYRWGVPTDINKWYENTKDLKNFAVMRPLNVMEDLQNNFDNPFVVFPNPCNDHFTIDFTSGSSTSFEYIILDITGKLIKSGEYNSASGIETINIDFEQGLYVMRVKVGKMFFSEKIIVR